MRFSNGSAASHIGARPSNQDRHLARPDLGVYAVADGIGGTFGGEIASALAIDTIERFFDNELRQEGRRSFAELEKERLSTAFRLAYRRILRHAEGRLCDMGTTLSVLVLASDGAVVAHVGDSRIYRLRGGELSRLTRDHSLFEEAQAMGMTLPATLGHGRHTITRALSRRAEPTPDIRIIDLDEAADRFLLCTDGLSNSLGEARIAELLAQPEEAAPELVSEAYEAGANDNITAVVASAER